MIDVSSTEPTLRAVLTREMRRALPGRLPYLLQLAFPLAIQFAILGWWRSGAWAFAISAFGAWGLADRWLATAPARGWRRNLARGARLLAATVAAVVPAVLLFELFFRLMGDAPIS